jgi:hypothetical protein
LEEIAGWGWTRTVHSDDIEAFLAKWRAALTSGEPFVHESRVRRADGEYRWMLNRNVALVNDEGKIVRWFGSSTEIDDRKRAETALRQTTDELRQSQFYLAEGQRLADIGSWSFTPDKMREILVGVYAERFRAFSKSLLTELLSFHHTCCLTNHRKILIDKLSRVTRFVVGLVCSGQCLNRGIAASA